MSERDNLAAGPEDQEQRRQGRREANLCMALGAGVGLMGVAGALTAGAVCPLCVVVAPGLIGYGAYMRWKNAAGEKQEEQYGGKTGEH